MRVQALDLNVLVREVLALYEAHSPHIGLDLQGDLPQVAGDAGRLRQVIHNLMQNAEQAVAERSAPRIFVQTRLEPDGVHLTVTDNGPGFAQDILARATEPYVTTRPKGTGLGLAIVRKILEEHHGRITIANNSNGGAQVSVVLPVSEPTMGAAQRQQKIEV
jgi:nitrogen fixation/metabolism regulation signal transduction histidine kinase